jgi:alpha-tubulin suppressor-like RCC1 family protein
MPLKKLKITQLSCGYFHTLALESDGSLWSWSSCSDQKFNFGQVGFEGEDSKPRKINKLDNVTLIKAGGYHSFAVSNDSLFSWGAGGFGQLGTGKNHNSITPLRV